MYGLSALERAGVKEPGERTLFHLILFAKIHGALPRSLLCESTWLF